MSEHRHTEVCRKDVKLQMIPNCKNEKQTNRILVKSMCVYHVSFQEYSELHKW
jgi:hypothetical protein